MNRIVAQILLAVATICGSGCQTYPVLPDLKGNAAIVLGFTTNSAQPYEGGTLYTGFHLTRLDGQPTQTLSRYDYIIMEPGEHRVQGECYWQLRGVMRLDDDLLEAGELVMITRPDHIYTLQSDIDEYKSQCTLSVIEKAQ